MEPFTLLIKPSGADGNLACAYCFYRDRAPEFGRGKQRMSVERLERLAESDVARAFAAQKEDIAEKCRGCAYLALCRGGCLNDRMRIDEACESDGGRVSRESSFCESYRQFFAYTVPRFREIAEAIRDGHLDRHTRPVETVRLRIG